MTEYIFLCRQGSAISVIHKEHPNTNLVRTVQFKQSRIKVKIYFNNARAKHLRNSNYTIIS